MSRRLAALGIVVVAGLAAAFAWRSSQPLDAKDLRMETKALEALSAEAALLPGNLLAGKITKTYFSVEAGYLGQKLRGSQKRLQSKEAEPPLQARRAQLLALFGRALSEVATMRAAAGDPSRATQAEHGLKSVLQQAGAMKEGS